MSILDCIGTTPDGGAEYQCSECLGYFGFEALDAEGDHTYVEPSFCPLCGSRNSEEAAQAVDSTDDEGEMDFGLDNPSDL
jgi:hypothetical protein